MLTSECDRRSASAVAYPAVRGQYSCEWDVAASHRNQLTPNAIFILCP